METKGITLRLTGTGVPEGEIALGDLAAIAHSLQELATRVGRHLAGQQGPGRTSDAFERVTRMRLRGLEVGSSRLAIAYGELDVRPVDVGAERDTARLFWEVIAGIGSGHRPTWVPVPVSRSALALIEALGRAATTVEVHRADGAHLRMRPASVRRDVWVTSETTVTDEETAVTGRLEAVDLKARRFRIRDDVGNSIDLDEVADAEAAAPLVGRRTRATGSGVLGARGQLKSLTGAVVEPDPLPATWVPGQSSDLTDVLMTPGPDPDGVEGLTSQDVEEFLAGLRG
jgi:hypothetical protein